MELSPGTAVTSELRLVRPLSAGAMGSIWVGEHARLRKQVAIKFVARSKSRDRAMQARFQREAAAISQIQSANVVRIHEYGETDGIPYMVMELLSGETLGQRLERETRLPIQLVTKIVRQVGSGLDAAHARGIVHRDIKPDNVFLVGRPDMPLVKLLDFGMAKQTRSHHQSIITATGVAVGTPEYMSPEQVLGSKDVDFRSDLWALAALAYRMLAGRVPFRATTPHALFFAICKGEFIPLDQVGIPPELDSFFRRAFQPNKDKRFGSAREAVLRFETLLSSAAPPEDPTLNDVWSDEDQTQLLEMKKLLEQSQALPLLSTQDEDATDLVGDDDVSTQRGARMKQAMQQALGQLAETKRLEETKTQDDDDNAATHELEAGKLASAIAEALRKHGDPAAQAPAKTVPMIGGAAPEGADAVAAAAFARGEALAKTVMVAETLDDNAPASLAPSDATGPHRHISGTFAMGEVPSAREAYSSRPDPSVRPPTQLSAITPIAAEPVRRGGGAKWIAAGLGLAAAAAAAFVFLWREAPPAVEAPAETAPAPATSIAPVELEPEVEPAPSTTVDLDTAPATGKVSIICEPVCSEVRIGDRSFGPSPVYKRDLEAGRYVVLLYREGVTKQVALEVVAGEETVKQVGMSAPRPLVVAQPEPVPPTPETTVVPETPPPDAGPPAPAVPDLQEPVF